MTRSHGGRSRGRNRPGVGRRDRFAGPRAAVARGESLVGTVIEVEVGSVAHGGFCVARHEGRVVFVRHTMPGERVRARVTEGGTENRFLRADAVEILTAAAERVDPRCRHAGPGGCGGCDWQHVSLPAQRELKAAVVEEQLRRLAGLERPVRVEALPGDDSGFHWRTRMEFAVGPDGRAGLRPHRSHAVLPITECPIAHPDLLTTDVLGQDWTGERALDVVVADSGTVVVPVPSGGSGPEITQLVAADRWSGELRLAARGFWQVHPSAAAALVDRVLGGLAAQRGERVLDLYAGVG
ncbi:MAG: TRAM domain-containing protein, partial [Candidatus Phosphoribacter sp.]